MKVYLGIDLGSTTSKAVFLDAEGHIIGRGITNTRSDYPVAARIAQTEAEFNSRFVLLRRKLVDEKTNGFNWDQVLNLLEDRFHYLQFHARFKLLIDKMHENAGKLEDQSLCDRIVGILNSIADKVNQDCRKLFFESKVSTTSQFFRDLFCTSYTHYIEDEDDRLFDQLIALYDRSITPVENHEITFDFADLIRQALKQMPGDVAGCAKPVECQLDETAGISMEPADYVGTGYGRQLLPFEEKHIKSEILCHAMGAHSAFPQTRTVLDIGGQDTKAIQVDSYGLVTSFQMNDRCAAGCGRYLGYIADEMNISVSDLGPIAMKATYEANICSTCTVFAGAELREYLNLGEKKENILAGLHKAIVQRAFALLARSGGVRNEFTFTGGVSRNPAIRKYVGKMVVDNYGEMTINSHSDSIFMGALGAALFAARRK